MLARSSRPLLALYVAKEEKRAVEQEEKEEEQEQEQEQEEAYGDGARLSTAQKMATMEQNKPPLDATLRQQTMQSAEGQKALRGELYHAFVPELVAARSRCQHACDRFNKAGDVSRRRLVELWRQINGTDDLPLPAQLPDPQADADLFQDEPWIEPPIRVDYGTNVRLGKGVFLNFNTVIIDTCLVHIGARTLLGPNCSIYSGTHPLDPALRNGTTGPEMGKEVHIEEDCWLGGNVIICPGVRIGRGSTVGAGSVVTKDIPPFHVAVGNPARILRKVETAMDPALNIQEVPPSVQYSKGAEEPMAQRATE